MKEWPACRSELPDDAVTCAYCGGVYDVDGSFRTSWDTEMARKAAERERKVSRAEAFGKWGRPHPHFFLEDKGGGCLVAAVAVAAAVAAGALL